MGFRIRRTLATAAHGHKLLKGRKHVASVEAGYLGDCFGRPFEQVFPWFADDAEWNATCGPPLMSRAIHRRPVPPGLATLRRDDRGARTEAIGEFRGGPRSDASSHCSRSWST